jgi:nucleoside-diphosphate-sugar epimerase
MCVSYAKEYAVPVVIARLSQTFGPGVSYDDGRVFAEFARSAIERRDIVLHTEGKTLRTYCYLRDAIEGIFCLMVHGTVGQAYNVTNMETKSDKEKSLYPQGRRS